MALRPGSGGGGSFMYPVGGGLGPPQGMMPMQQQQQQQGFPMVPVMQPNMQGMMGMNFAAQMPAAAMPMQGGLAMGMQAPGMQFMGRPQFMGMRAPGPQYPADLQKQMAEEHQKRLEQQQRMLEEDRKRRQFEEQKQKLRLLSSVKPKTGEKSRDDALEAIKGNLDGFSRDAKMHPTPSAGSKKTDSSPSHSSVPPHSVSPAFAEDDDEFSDFIQGPVDAPFPCSSLPLPSSSTAVSKSPLEAAAGPRPSSSPVPFLHAPSLPPSTAPHHSSVISSSQSAFQGPSLEEKLLCSFDLTADKKAQVNFRSRQAISELTPKSQVMVQFHSSPKARNWAQRSDDLSTAFTVETITEPLPAPAAPTAVASPPGIHQESGVCGVGVYPQQEIQSMLPAWLYNDALIPDMFKKVLEMTMTPAGIDTAKLYPILMSSGLPREALGQIWASANRTTPGKLTKEELYTVLALIGVAQSGLPAMNPDILGQFPSPPVPNLPAMAMAMPAVLAHQQPMIPPAGPAVMPMAPNPLAQPPSSFVANFPPVQGTKVDDDDFQDFQEAPKTGDDSFTDFQGDTGGTFSSVPTSQSSIPVMLTPVSGSSSTSTSDKYAVFKNLSVEQTTEPTPPASDPEDKYSVFRELEPSDRKPVGEGFADFKSVGADDGFTDFKTANSTSPLDPPDQTKTFQPASFPLPFGPSHSLQQSQSQPAPLAPAPLAVPKNPLNMADLDLFSSINPPSTVDPKSSSASSASAVPPLLHPSAGPKPDDFGDFALFGSSSSSSSASEAAASASRVAGGGGTVAVAQDDFADFLAFGSSGKQQNEITKESDDFADFQSSRFLVDKMAAFKQTKEDSASVKSLDLPSIGGSSAGKDDSEDALSVQLDLKLADVAGELRHGASDSSLDLPGLSSHQPPAADADDMKFDPFGSTSSGGPATNDRSDKDDTSSVQSTKLPVLHSSAVLHKKETSFGSSENVTHTTLAKVTTFPIEDSGFADFADFSSARPAAGGDHTNNDFGDFASTVSEKSDSVETGLEGTQSEVSDDFGAFQADKPKFGKSDFLKASAQPKVKSSEEMIKNELATFDLSVQGSHKRSHSLGEKEICSTPSPAPEQLFRDRSNTLNEKPALPVIRDKYKDLTGEVEESERYAYEWQRCLESALQVITTANNTLNGISSSTVCTEVIQSAQGMEYLLGVVEVYRVARRVELGIKATAVCSEKLQELLKDISRVWNNLMGFMSLSNLTPDESSLDFSSCILRHGIKNAKELACGVCLLNVDSRSKAFNSETDNFKLTYGGHQYHASCANFWINCVEPKPPGLILPDLL
ncbi:synergin gamma isoform X2 [Trichomycterus rosablanca]|uniref:synergin gamma isoform X2 n=1 Tax=Trichomycterus rosablanca TaxID=2290929 RepID=UPI002F35AF8D